MKMVDIIRFGGLTLHVYVLSWYQNFNILYPLRVEYIRFLVRWVQGKCWRQQKWWLHRWISYETQNSLIWLCKFAIVLFLKIQANWFSCNVEGFEVRMAQYLHASSSKCDFFLILPACSKTTDLNLTITIFLFWIRKTVFPFLHDLWLNIVVITWKCAIFAGVTFTGKHLTPSGWTLGLRLLIQTYINHLWVGLSLSDGVNMRYDDSVLVDMRH